MSREMIINGKKFYVHESCDCWYIGFTEFNKPSKLHDGYKFLIDNVGLYMCPRAYRTVRGFKQFVQVYNLKKFGIVTAGEYRGEKYICGRLLGKFKVLSFWHKEDLPKGCKKFIDLCNGSYVECYYIDIKGVRIIFKPNPNAKEVYKSLDYFKYAKLYG